MPTLCRSRTLFPVPDGPMTTEIFPAGIWHVPPSRTTLSSKALWTLSTSTMYSPFEVWSSAFRARSTGVSLSGSEARRSISICLLSRGDREVGILAPEDLGEDRVHHHRQHQADRHGLGHGPADADRATAHVVAVIDTDADHQEGEDDRLDHRVAKVREVRKAPEVREIDAVRNQADLKTLHHPAGEEAGGQGQHVHEGQYQKRGDHPGRDQEGDGWHTHRLQRIDLFVDPHGAQLRDQSAAHLRPDGEAEEDGGDLAHVAERVEDTGQALRAAQLVK